jgi:hypothetical protein
VLINTAGKIVWQGHPSSVTASMVRDAIKGAISTPIYEWSGSAKSIKKAFLKGDFAKAIKAADKLGAKEELGNEIGEMLRGMVGKRVAGIEKDLENGDVAKAFDGAKELSTGIKGLPEEETLTALLSRISKDKDLKAALKTQQKLGEIVATERGKKKECDECISKLEKLLKGNEGTHTGDLISAAIKALRVEKGKLKR